MYSNNFGIELFLTLPPEFSSIKAELFNIYLTLNLLPKAVDLFIESYNFFEYFI